ncbi:hypothetical protein C5167_034110 [Papaver somniferum]|uniref:Uncharacterized protein n=1 Tax=Papaver somniferum TaxID=3469 RepID=A0A4Y7KG55_PAPSO|nr:hypothetical protein C5167_034110 [Papaver somniferum]
MIRPKAEEGISFADLMEFVGMIMGPAGSTVCYNLKLTHLVLDMPYLPTGYSTIHQVFLKGVEAWNQYGNDNDSVEYKPLPSGPTNGTEKQSNESGDAENVQ